MALRTKLRFSQLFPFLFLVVCLDGNKIESSLEIQAPRLVRVQCQSFSLIFLCEPPGFGETRGVLLLPDTAVGLWSQDTLTDAPSTTGTWDKPPPLPLDHAPPHCGPKHPEQRRKQTSKEHKIRFVVGDSCERG